MTMFKGRYRIESTRLRGWDYTAGWYFVTICTHQRRHCFGAIVDDAVFFSPIGAIVAEEWQRTAQVRSNIILDAWVIMPNHFHGIIAIRNGDGDGDGDDVETPRRGVSTTRPTPTRPTPTRPTPAQPASVLRAGSLGRSLGNENRCPPNASAPTDTTISRGNRGSTT